MTPEQFRVSYIELDPQRFEQPVSDPDIPELLRPA